MVERYGVGWQERHQTALKASRIPGGSAFGGGGYRHVPGQTGMYANYLSLGGPPEGIGTARILAGGKMAAYRAGIRIAGSPIRAPTTYTSERGGAPFFTPTESLKGGEAFMPLAGSPLTRGIFGGTASTILSGGGGVGQTGLDPAGAGLAAHANGGALGGLGGGIGGIGGDISNIGSGIMDTAKSYVPLAIKIVLAVIGIKIVLWILGGRK